MAMAMTTASLPSALASSQSGKMVHGREQGRQRQQQQKPNGKRGRSRREITTMLTNRAAWRSSRDLASFVTCKLEFGARLSTSRCAGRADFMRVQPLQSIVRRVITSRLDDEFQGAEGAPNPGGEMSSLEGENTGKEVQIDLQLPRRRLQVEFTCNVCGTRTQRLINPEAYKRGTVYVQCGGCETYHQLVDNLGLVVEYDFREETDSNSS